MEKLLKALRLHQFEELSKLMWKDYENLNLTPKELAKPYIGTYPVEEIKNVLIEIQSCNPGWNK